MVEPTWGEQKIQRVKDLAKDAQYRVQPSSSFVEKLGKESLLALLKRMNFQSFSNQGRWVIISTNEKDHCKCKHLDVRHDHQAQDEAREVVAEGHLQIQNKLKLWDV